MTTSYESCHDKKELKFSTKSCQTQVVLPWLELVLHTSHTCPCLSLAMLPLSSSVPLVLMNKSPGQCTLIKHCLICIWVHRAPQLKHLSIKQLNLEPLLLLLPSPELFYTCSALSRNSTSKRKH